MVSRGVSTVPVWMVMAVVVMVVAVMNGVANGDVNTDTQECADQLAGMATCLAYVQGQAKAPTPDCCSGLKQVLNTSKKCLCVIVKDGNDPQLALNINVTLALGLPSVCHASANISQCPALLHLDPNSPDAQVFYKYGNTSSNIAAAPGPDIAPGPTTGAGSSASSAASPPMSNDGTARRAGRGEGYSLVVFLWCLMFANLLA